jgi:NhaP-type Na+/H+ and K+/H+ antiporter
MAVFLTIGLIELLVSPQATVLGMIVLFIQNKWEWARFVG